MRDVHVVWWLHSSHILGAAVLIHEFLMNVILSIAHVQSVHKNGDCRAQKYKSTQHSNRLWGTLLQCQFRNWVHQTDNGFTSLHVCL